MNRENAPDFVARLAQFQQADARRLEEAKRSDTERDALVKEVIGAYERLRVQYDERDNDYHNEVESRRLWQAKAREAQQTLAQQKLASGFNNFALALIDGDGAIFTDYLYSMGKEGGAEAAHQLHTELQKSLQATYPDTNVSDWNIVVQVCLNMQGLANKLLSLGKISHPNELQAFGRAFGLAQPLFSFVDVGGGKERADHKLRETLRLYVPITQCKHVFFGGCNDNGYLPVLEPYRRDAAVASRLTLLETRPAEPGFIELGLKRLRLPRIFRSDNLPMSSTRPPPILSPLPTPVKTPAQSNGIALAPTISRNASPALSTESGNSAPSTSAPSISAPSISAPSTSAASTSAAGSWATVGKNGTATKTISIAPKKAPQRKCILVNAYGERVDPELPRTDAGAESRFAERLKNQGKCCNNFHLTGRCDSGEYCDYIHDVKLTPGELLVLKHKARSRSCPKKSSCRDLDCTFGHHCKFGSLCNFDVCYFADSHRMDTTPVKKIYSDGTEEWHPTYAKQYGITT